ncbi:MAG: IPT/TIG domain-containing protein [Actinobacteria bacterium]|nr:IPT/TIG domain-containing protein [Actinomycetota bacterium]
MGKLRFAAALIALGLTALLAPGNAAAGTVTLGSELITPQTMTTIFSGSTVTVANPEPLGPRTVAFSPVDGRIVRWRLGPQSGSDEYRLTVLRPDGSGAYAAIATSDPERASSTAIEVFTTALPIEAGDLIGLNVQSTEAHAQVHAGGAGAVQFAWVPSLGIGGPAAAPTTTVGGIEFGFNADVQPTPEVSLVSPSSGPVGGGTAVTIVGRDFSQVSGVTFGSTPASSFAVLAEDRIVAVAPPATTAGPVDVTVTNAVGASAAGSADRFTYLAPAPVAAPTPTAQTQAAPRGCTVPRLTDKTLPASRRILSRSGCRLGAVRGHRQAGKKVTRQSPRPGVVRPPGWAVNVTIR